MQKYIVNVPCTEFAQIQPQDLEHLFNVDMVNSEQVVAFNSPPKYLLKVANKNTRTTSVM